MPKLNMELREKVKLGIELGMTNAQIGKETGFGQINSIREIVVRGLPLDTRIRKDGTLNTEGVAWPKRTPEEKRAAYLASQKRYADKIKSAGVQKLKDLETVPEPKKDGKATRIEKHMILSCCTRQEQTPEEVSTARKNFLSTSLKLLASDIVSAFPEVNMNEFDEILRKVSQ